MAIVRRILNGAAATVIGAASIVALVAQPAQAVVDPASCTYGYDLSIPQVTATCTDPASSGWYLRVACWTPRQTIVYVNGTLVYGPGRGTSRAQCPWNTELGQYAPVNL